MGYDKQRFLNMLAMGMCSKARVGTALPPSVYLALGQWNNGVRVPLPEIYLYGKDQIPLPKLPTWNKETYQNAAIVHADNCFALIVSDTPFSTSSNSLWFGENWQAYRVHGTEFVLSTTSNTWEFMDGIVWANCDIYEMFNTSVLVFEKSEEPVLDATEHSYCLCNGMLLPAFPELPYDYAAIGVDVYSEVTLYCSITKYHLTTSGTASAHGANTYNISYSCTGAEWMVKPSFVGHSPTIIGDLFWSNHDIIDTSGLVGEVGSIYFPKSDDPIPVDK